MERNFEENLKEIFASLIFPFSIFLAGPLKKSGPRGILFPLFLWNHPVKTCWHLWRILQIIQYTIERISKYYNRRARIYISWTQQTLSQLKGTEVVLLINNAVVIKNVWNSSNQQKVNICTITSPNYWTTMYLIGRRTPIRPSANREGKGLV